jgi:hypothetical protein
MARHKRQLGICICPWTDRARRSTIAGVMSEALIRQVTDREYLGMARVLRTRIAVAAAETNARIAAIVRTEKANFKRRNKGPRPESLLAIERVWRDLPAFGLLDEDITCTKKSLVIVEHRMVANKLVRLPGVSVLDEPGVVIVRGTLSLQPGSVEWTPTVTTTLSLHTMARRYKRGYGDDDEAYFADLNFSAWPTNRIYGRSGQTLQPN